MKFAGISISVPLPVFYIAIGAFKMRHVLLITFLAVLAGQQLVNSAQATVEHKSVERTIDLTSQLVKINYKITLSGDATSYEFLVPSSMANKLSYISAKDSLKKKIRVGEPKRIESTGANSYTLQLTAGSSPSIIYIETVFTKALTPHPTHITQAEKQLVRFFGQLYFYTPYKTTTQKTTVLLSSRNVESYTQVKPVSHSDTTITYGPYENIAALRDDEELMVHYENQTPFLTVAKMLRTIEISHWGNIAVEETIDLVHSGAILKGSFSRYDFQRDTRSGAASVKSYKTILPASATGVYYR